jgi:hypothetical protein
MEARCEHVSFPSAESGIRSGPSNDSAVKFGPCVDVTTVTGGRQWPLHSTESLGGFCIVP